MKKIQSFSLSAVKLALLLNEIHLLSSDVTICDSSGERKGKTDPGKRLKERNVDVKILFVAHVLFQKQQYSEHPLYKARKTGCEIVNCTAMDDVLCTILANV